MYNKSLNSPELKALRGIVNYRTQCDKNSDLLEVKDHTSHKTLIPRINYEECTSSEETDIISEDNIISTNNDGIIFFNYPKNYDINKPYKVVFFTGFAVSYNTLTGEIEPEVEFEYNGETVRTNKEGYYVFEQE